MASSPLTQTFEYDPILETGFSHTHSQSSVKSLVENGAGDCYAYAKYRLLAEPWLALFARYDAGTGIHFGAVDFDNGIVLHHLVSTVKTQRLVVDEDVSHLVASGTTLVTATQRPDGYYGLHSEKDPVKALFYNTYEWKNVFRHIQMRYDARNPWRSTLQTLIELDN